MSESSTLMLIFRRRQTTDVDRLYEKLDEERYYFYLRIQKIKNKYIYTYILKYSFISIHPGTK